MPIRPRRSLMFVLALALALPAVLLPTPRVMAQDGPITFNTPEIIALNQGVTVRLTFSTLQGETVDLNLSRLAQFGYTAVLIDPASAAIPLTQGPDGTVAASITNVPQSGMYTLVLQATDGSGQLLVQVNNTPPVPLAFGVTDVTVTGAPQRFSLDAYDGPSVLRVSAPGTPDDPGALPGLRLADAEANEDVLTIEPGVLPAVIINLPEDRAFTLLIADEDTTDSPTQLVIEWQPDTQASTPPASDSSSSNSDSSPPDSTSATTGQCAVYFSGPVNVRPGPGTQYTPPLGQVQAGTTLAATGHNGDYSWYQVNYGGQLGWVALFVGATEAQGDCAALPVASYPGGPQVTASATYTPEYTSTPSYTPSPTYTPGGPTVTPVPPTATYTPSYTPTTAQQQGPTATYTPSYTPTTQQAPTATYTPSYTPTTPPPVPTAPPDANFNAPLNIPLDSTASVTDFVSYPGGDTIDRVRWDISGMNQNPSLSGGRARLILAVSCFGTGTQNITFFTGGQTYSCGQTIVDREVTYDSRTGQVTIEAVGGTNTYVQWVLTGTATRLN